MKNMIKVVSLAGIIAIAGIGGTFAYFNQTDRAVNEFWTGTYDMELVEEFKPKEGENWEPGTSVNKDVHVENQGSLPVVVRVKFGERWTARADSEEGRRQLYYMDTQEIAEANLPATATSSDAVPMTDRGLNNPDPAEGVKNKFESVYQADPNDGKTGESADDSVVHKKMDPENKWVYNPRDGYYYYTEVLAGKTKDGIVDRTTLILDEVTLDENVDMGSFTEMKYFRSEGSDAWTEFDKDPETGKYYPIEKLVDDLKEKNIEIAQMKATPVMDEEDGIPLSGYRDADYVLTVTAQTVQATDGAVTSIFGLDAEMQSILGLEWNLAKESDVRLGDEPVQQTGQE